MRPEQLTLEMLEKVTKRPAAYWAGQCFWLATEAAKLVEGATAVYGHFRGKVSPESPVFGHLSHVGWVHHGWVVLKDKSILDPTRWAFENVQPYIYLGEAKEYDEGGNGFRHAMLRPPPQFKPGEKMAEITEDMLDSPAFNHMEGLLRVDHSVQEPGTFCASQMFWIANAPYDVLQPHAAAIYKAIEALGTGWSGLIPIDNRRRAAREAGR